MALVLNAPLVLAPHGGLFLRHERMTVRMELAAALHHSRDVGSGKNDGLRAQKTVNSREDAVFFELFDEDTARVRPTCLVEPPGPQERVPRHTVEQMADVAPMVQILDAPVLQMVEHVVDVLKTFDRGLAEQVIEVAKVTLQDVVPQRAVLRVSQLAEQLVDMPVPESVILAHGRCDLGVKWCQIATSSGAARRDSAPAQGGI